MPDHALNRNSTSDRTLIFAAGMCCIAMLAIVSVMVTALRLPLFALVAILAAFFFAFSSEAVVVAVVAWGMMRGIPALSALNEDSTVAVMGRSVSTVGASLLVLLVFVALRCVTVLIRRGFQKAIEWRPFVFPLFAAVSLLWSGGGSPLGARWVGYLAVMGGVFYLVAYDIALDKKRRGAFVALLLASLILFCGGSLADRRVLEVSTDVRFQDARGARLKGIADSPNVLAGTVATLGSISIAILFTKGVGGRWRAGAAASLAICAAVVLLTESRSGLIGVGLAVAIALLVTNRWRYIAAVAMLAILLLAVGNRPSVLDSWRDFARNPFDDTLENWQTATARLIIWRDAMTGLVRPVGVPFGRGAGTVDTWCRTNPSCSDAGGIHSDLLRTFIDLGATGVVIILAMFARVAARGWKVARRRGSLAMSRALALAGVCALAASVPRLLWDLLFNAQIGWFLVIVIGLMPAKTAAATAVERHGRTR